MPLPRIVAVSVCAGVLGAQLAISSPLAPDRSWYWPFLPYPMYSSAHARSDTIAVPQLRASACGTAKPEVDVSAQTLGVPLHQLTSLLSTIARSPDSDVADSAKGRLSRAIEAEYPARYCEMSAWVRTVRVSDASTYNLENPMRRAAAWNVNRADSR
jgi:hypothetical protein